MKHFVFSTVFYFNKNYSIVKVKESLYELGSDSNKVITDFNNTIEKLSELYENRLIKFVNNKTIIKNIINNTRIFKSLEANGDDYIYTEGYIYARNKDEANNILMDFVNKEKSILCSVAF